MKFFLYLFLLTFFKVSAEDPKLTIEKCLVELKESGDKPSVYKKLTLAYLEDQDLSGAFQAALKATPECRAKNALPQLGDVALYEEALKIYLEHNGSHAPQINAEKILEKYGPVVDLHPDYLLLNYLLAAGAANLNLYKEFLERFFKSYEAYPDHYMAFKTKAVLHIKLYERASSVEEKEALRKEVGIYVKKALEKYPCDIGLYRLLIAFASPEEKKGVVAMSLSKMLQESMIVPRADISFFVQEAVAEDLPDLARQLIDKAKLWYEVSRVVEAAEKYLDRKEGRG